MKKIVLYLFLSLSMYAVGFSQIEDNCEAYKIMGRIAGLPDGDLFLVANNGVKMDTLAQTKSMNGNFLFSGRVNEVTMVQLVTAKRQVIASMMLENAEFTVMGQDIVVGGGVSQKLLAQFDQLDIELIQERKNLEEQYVEAEKKNDQKRMGDAESKYQKFLMNIQTKELELLKQCADTYVAAYIVFSTMSDIGLEKLVTRYNILGEHAKATSFGKAIAKQIECYERVEIGRVAPDFHIDNITLHQLKGKLKIINFWAAWSKPCREENVNLLRIYEQYHLKGVTIISVSLGDNQQTWKKAILEDGITEWRQIADFDEQYADMMSTYCLKTIPYTYILDENNVIVAKGLQGEALKKKIGELLKEK